MPTLEQAIVNLGNNYLDRANHWYQWRNINPANYLPLGVTQLLGNHYSQNELLKLQLNALYTAPNASNDTKLALTHYYIAVWGGVKRNSPEKLLHYALSAPADLINQGSGGIASWSKALCIRNPDNFAIYDARVAVSLNALQIANQVDNPSLFPLLTGQNKFINRGSRRIRQHANDNGWDNRPMNDFYQEYNNVLSAAANLLNVRLYTLEMLLFSQAPELLQAAFPGEQL